MLTIAVCDDNPIHREHSAALVGRYLPNAKIEAYSDPEIFLSNLGGKGSLPDIAVLDIEMGNMTGIELAESLNRYTPDCQIIFLTAHADFAPEAYKARHVWFIVKSRAEEFLPEALDRAVKMLSEKESSPVLNVRADGRNVLIPVSSMLYMEKVGRKMRLVCTDGEYLTYQQPSALISPELEEFFVRCHQGYWINLKHVEALDHNDFVMTDGIRIPISRTYRDSVREAFFSQYRL